MTFSILPPPQANLSNLKQGNLRISAPCFLLLLLTFFVPLRAAAQTTPHAMGIDGTTVYLNDLEDHSWSYYNDPDCPIRSLNPADVTITYYGNGTNTVSTTTDATPATDSWTADATTVKVGIATVENQNTFVYYKTLERTDGATATSVSGATGRCEYTTIPNPFQVRPTYGSNTTDKWRGFYKWRVKSVSGGTIYTTANGTTTIATGGTIDAEQTVYFAPTNSTGMEVELEALWARAYVATAGNDGANNIDSNNVGYERNFIVLTTDNIYNFGGSNGRRISNTGYAATVSSYYPDGTAGSSSSRIRGQRTGTSSYTYPLTLSADTKFEYVDFNMGSYTITADGHNLIIGRGCTGTVNYVSGLNQGKNTKNYYDYTSNLNYTIRIESGTINYLSFLAGYIGTDGKDANAFTKCLGKANLINGVLGCDYDRANTTSGNNNLTIYGSIFYGCYVNMDAQDGSKKTFELHVKSGKFLTYLGTDMGTGAAHQSMYLSIASSIKDKKTGERQVTVEGGEMCNIAGGVDANQDGDNHVRSLTFRMRGGTVKGAVYGGGAVAPAYGDRWMVFTGGTVNGWIGAGCNGVSGGSNKTGGQTNGESFVYIGGKTYVGGSSDINGSAGGTVFGAGKGSGASDEPESGKMSYGSNLVVADAAEILNNVYGGGNYGFSDDYTNLYILGGKIHGSVFGGSNQNKGSDINILMTGGTVEGGLYGGSNTTGTISGNVTMQINGGQVGTESKSANIHGGGYGSATRVSGNVNLTLGSGCNATSGVTVYGDVYGGSADGYVNGTTATNTYSTNVTLYAGTIHGALYGGGYGITQGANVYGPVKVKVYGGSVLTTDGKGENGSGSIFGCNNAIGAPQNSVNVDIYGTDTPTEGQTYALHAVYGGGNKAAYTKTPVVAIHGCSALIGYVYGGGNATDVAGTDVTIWGCKKIGDVFGGGNGAGSSNPGANITTNGAKLKIYGGTIERVFGGSNEKGSITDAISITVKAATESGNDPCTDKAYTECNMQIGALYRGGNKAELKNGSGQWLDLPALDFDCTTKIESIFGGSRSVGYGKSITLDISQGTFTNVFGGNDVDGIVEGDVTVNITGGTVANVFGGNNKGGDIKGKITVNINKSTPAPCDDKFQVGNVYGGGKEAPYTPTTVGNYPEVNIINGTVDENVYGGGLGTGANVKSNPLVTVGGKAGSKQAGTVVIKGDVFGGGRGILTDLDAAKVTGNPQVILVGGEIMGSVYGGGHMGQVDGSTRVELK